MIGGSKGRVLFLGRWGGTRMACGVGRCFLDGRKRGGGDERGWGGVG